VVNNNNNKYNNNANNNNNNRIKNIEKINMDFGRSFNKTNTIEIEEKSTNNKLGTNNYNYNFDGEEQDEVSMEVYGNKDMMDLDGNSAEDRNKNQIVLCISDIDIKDLELNNDLFSKENKKAIKKDLNKIKDEVKNDSLDLTNTNANEEKDQKKKLVGDIINELNSMTEREKQNKKKIIIVVVTFIIISIVFFFLLFKFLGMI